jgi:signal transduction histidine kinase
MKKIINYFKNTLQGKIVKYFFTIIMLSNIVTFKIISLMTNREIIDNFRISIEQVKGFHRIKFLALIINGVLSITLLCILSFLFVSKLKKLIRATNEVAEGNFDVEIEYCGKDELGQLTEHFNKMAKKLKNTAYIQKDFMNNVSHEIKTPISSIQGFAKILKRKNLTEKEREEYLDIIIEEAKRLENISINVLRLSKLENQDVLENEDKFKIDESIRKAILILQNKWIKKNIEFDLNLDKTYYYGEEELFIQVFTNIIENAIKFSKENGKIEVRINKNIDYIEISIKDYGVGMDEYTKEHIFDKFYQGDKSRNDIGYGLGMSIVKRIVELSKGKIFVESKLNEGTEFMIKLNRV